MDHFLYANLRVSNPYPPPPHPFKHNHDLGFGAQGPCRSPLGTHSGKPPPTVRAIAVHSSLTAIDIQCNKIGVEGALRLSEVLMTNNTLCDLNLAGNAIMDEGCEVCCLELHKAKAQGMGVMFAFHTLRTVPSAAHTHRAVLHRYPGSGNPGTPRPPLLHGAIGAHLAARFIWAIRPSVGCMPFLSTGGLIGHKTARCTSFSA